MEETFQLYRGSTGILGEGGFNLRKFQTNDVDLQRRIEEAEGIAPHDGESETYARVTLENRQRAQNGEQKVLGIYWSVNTDEFVLDLCCISEASTSLVPTKRNVVSLIWKVYDPFGILSQFLDA